jgi:hypothetical protein
VVKELADCGVPQEIIAGRISVSPKTLRKHYREELDVALAGLAQKLMTPALAVATDSSHDQFARMNIFMQQTRLGAKATSGLELTGADGRPLEPPGLRIVVGSHPSQGGDEDPDAE